MSHYYVGVIVPKDTEGIEAKVRELLALYDENIEVEEHDEDCYCVGNEATREAREQTEKKFPIEELRKKFAEEISDPYEAKLMEDNPALTKDDMFGYTLNDDYIDDEWEKMRKPRTDFEEEFITNHPMKDEPNPECDECEGTGIYKSTYNPDSKWDWYSFGGRWNGTINGNYEGSGDGFNFGSEFREVEQNIAKVTDVIANEQEIRAIEDEKERNKAIREKTRIPFAIVTPDGEWHSRGKMGWFGQARDKKDNWEEDALELLEQYKDDLIVGMDLHI